jgi:hypothetical protein
VDVTEVGEWADIVEAGECADIADAALLGFAEVAEAVEWPDTPIFRLHFLEYVVLTLSSIFVGDSEI